MKILMTFCANRNYIETMFRGIAMPVMILLCLCGAVMALQGIRPRQSAGFDRIIDLFYSFTSFRMANLVEFYKSTTISFSFFAFSKTILNNFAFFTSGITFQMGFPLFGLISTVLSGPALFAFAGALVDSFTFFSFLVLTLIYILARSAPRMMAVFIAKTFVKLRQRFALLALGAGLRYDFSSHNQLLNSWLRSEPVGSTILPIGSLIIQAPEDQSRGIT